MARAGGRRYGPLRNRRRLGAAGGSGAQVAAEAVLLLLEDVDDCRDAVLAPRGRMRAGPLEGHLLLVGRTAQADAADPLLPLDLLELLADLAAGIDRAVAEQVELDRRLLGQRQPLPLLVDAVVLDADPVGADELSQILLDGVQLPLLVLAPNIVKL